MADCCRHPGGDEHDTVIVVRVQVLLSCFSSVWASSTNSDAEVWLDNKLVLLLCASVVLTSRKLL